MNPVRRLEWKNEQEQLLNVWVTQAVCAGFLLFGAGSSPEIVQATPPAGPPSAVIISPAGLTFGTLPVGTTSPSKVATLANRGTETVTISDVLTSGIDFSQANNCRAILAAGASCTIAVTFKPVISGPRIGTLNVLDSDGGSPHMIVLSGSGN
jgi:Abnormal spindle-like microcephaly-assoc'd, ASPM-SPD-2-Hydin